MSVPSTGGAAQPGGGEAMLVQDLVRLARRQWPVRRLGLEVRSHGRCRTDVCLLLRQPDEADPTLVGVEAKLTDWARAVAQAAANRYAFDVSYVALPASRTTGSAIAGARAHGVGVIAVGSGSLEVVLAGAANTPDPVLRARVMAQLAAVRPLRPRSRPPAEGAGLPAVHALAAGMRADRGAA